MFKGLASMFGAQFEDDAPKTKALGVAPSGYETLADGTKVKVATMEDMQEFASLLGG